ncbi:hypothetical protein BA898_09465 [Spiribacter roseus]|nr:hypothetical protein BA898_09465 [Spiribacter roseus]
MPHRATHRSRIVTELLIDIGNSRVKWARAHEGQIVGGARAASHDSLEHVFSEWRALAAPPERVRLVNVSDASVAGQLSDWMTSHWAIRPETVHTPAMGGGVRVAYARPAELGTDRWLAMVGAKAAGYAPACVVDCGTAITVDVVAADGTHQGGLIVAGLAAQQEGLAQLAPALPRVKWSTRAPFLTADTEDALISGYLHGTALAIQGIVRRCMKNDAARLTPVLTGGDAPLLARYLDMDVCLRPDLVLEGLAQLP